MSEIPSTSKNGCAARRRSALVPHNERLFVKYGPVITLSAPAYTCIHVGIREGCSKAQQAERELKWREEDAAARSNSRTDPHQPSSSWYVECTKICSGCVHHAASLVFLCAIVVSFPHAFPCILATRRTPGSRTLRTRLSSACCWLPFAPSSGTPVGMRHRSTSEGALGRRQSALKRLPGGW